MEIIIAVWIAVFLLFFLALLFSWSKIAIIAGKTKRLGTEFDALEGMKIERNVDSRT
jgi:hypothetical protein